MRYDYPMMGSTVVAAPQMEHHPAGVSSSQASPHHHHRHHHHYQQHYQVLDQHQHQLHQYNPYRHRPHQLLPHAPPTSQLHSSSSSFSSSAQLAQQQPQMPLFFPFSLPRAGTGGNSKAARSGPQQTKTKPGPGGCKPVKSGRGPVDASDLSRRLHTVLAHQELLAGARANSSVLSFASTMTSSPLAYGPSRGPAPALAPAFGPIPMQVHGTDRAGRRIRSRGSGNLRAVYAASSNPMTSTVGGPIRRQPFSAPHLSALAPPPTLPELQRRNRARSSSPRLRMPGAAVASLSPHTMATTTTIARVNPRTSAASAAAGAAAGFPTSVAGAAPNKPRSTHPHPPGRSSTYAPSQATKQSAQTTTVIGGPRRSIPRQKLKRQHLQQQPIPLQQQQGLQQKGTHVGAMRPTGAVTASGKTRPTDIQHTFKDAPGTRRESMKATVGDSGADKDAETVSKRSGSVRSNASVHKDGEFTKGKPEDEKIDPETATEADVEAEAKAAKASKVAKAASALDFRRIVQEHNVGWTQSDEAPVQRKKDKKDKKEKKKKQDGGEAADEVKQTRPLWRLKARLSSFSKDRRSPSPPVVEDEKVAPPVIIAAAARIQEEPSDAPFVAEAVTTEEAATDAAAAASTSTSSSTPSSTLSLTSTAIGQASSSKPATMRSSQSGFLSLFKH